MVREKSGEKRGVPQGPFCKSVTAIIYYWGARCSIDERRMERRERVCAR
jgi:hypothetical protein